MTCTWSTLSIPSSRPRSGNAPQPAIRPSGGSLSERRMDHFPSGAPNIKRRGLLTGPAYVNLDASLVKIIRFGSRRAEVRADFFNALNTPHYANPNGTFGDGNFGRITEILPLTERVIRFGGRFLF